MLGSDVADGFSLRGLVTAMPRVAAGRSGAQARRLGDSRLFFAGVARDTDFIAEANVLGFEAYWQLRSPASPERHVLQNRLAPGVALRQAGQAVEILKGGREVAKILPPQAFDADGRPVKVEQILRGRDLEVFVDHRRSDVRYPVLVDPSYAGEDWFHPGTPTWHHGNAEGLEAWAPYAPYTGITAGNVCNVNVNCFDGNNLGLFLQAQPGGYSDGQGAFWQFIGQGQGSSTYISSLQGAFVAASTKGQAQSNASALLQILDTSGSVVNQTDTMNNGGNPSVSNPTTHGTVARFALRMNGAGTRTGWNSFDVGGALVVMRENSAPYMSAGPNLSWSTNTWYTGGAELTAQPTFYNTGFGIYENEVAYPTAAGRQAQTVLAGCDGHYLTRCNFSFQTPFTIPTADMPEGVNYVELYSYSPSGNGSSNYKYAYKIDHSAPTQTLSGSLYAGRNGVIGSGTYSLHIAAQDWGGTSCTDTRDAVKRSGVATVAIELDGAAQSGPPAQPTETCSLSYDWPFDAARVGAGPHEVRVTTTDHMGLPTTEAFTVTISLPPQNSVRPTISGQPVDGATLTASNGTWVGAAALSYDYQWERCNQDGSGCAAIPGATAQTYQLFYGDVGRVIKVRVSATNLYGADDVESAATVTVSQAGSATPLKDGLDSDTVDTFDDSQFPAADFCDTLPEDGGIAYCGTTDTSADLYEQAQREPGIQEIQTLLAGENGGGGTGGTAYRWNHTAFGISDNIVTSDALDLFGGPFRNTPCRPSPPQPASANGDFTALALTKVRLIVPWDVMDGQNAPCGSTARTTYDNMAEWVQDAVGKYDVLISFERSRSDPDDCTTGSCHLPSAGEYSTKVETFVNTFPGVTNYTAWNEPNQGSQPTYGHPKEAGTFFHILEKYCATPPQNCRFAAGDFLDATGFLGPSSSGIKTYLNQYVRGAGHWPRLWAWHAYSTGYRHSHVRFDQFMSITAAHTPTGHAAPRVWLTEQGAYVCERMRTSSNNIRCSADTQGQTGQNADEAAANNDLHYLLEQFSAQISLTRVTRFYLYEWRGTNSHDTGLVDKKDGHLRAMYATFKADSQ